MSDTVLIRQEDRVIAYTEQDVEDIIEANKRLQSTPQKCDWGRHVATIPNVFLTRWLNEELARGNTTLRMYSKEFDALVERKLKDPDWKFLRTDGPQSQKGWSR